MIRIDGSMLGNLSPHSSFIPDISKPTSLRSSSIITPSSEAFSSTTLLVSDSDGVDNNTASSSPPSTQTSISSSYEGYRSRNSSGAGDASHALDVSLLAAEAKELVSKAEIKVRQRKNLFVWFKKWIKRQISSSEKDSVFTAFIPKVKDTLEDVNTWLRSISERKVLSVKESNVVIRDLREVIAEHQTKVDFLDDLLNDYRIQLQLLSVVASEVRVLVAFNEELIGQRLSAASVVAASVSEPNVIEDVQPSRWTGYKPIDSVKVSSPAFKQALRNYVPKSIAPPWHVNRVNSAVSARPDTANVARKDRPPLSCKTGSCSSLGKSASGIIREKSKLESEADEEHRCAAFMAEDADHFMLFARLDAVKEVLCMHWLAVPGG